ncbi:MAG: 4Fe-4S binding protein, partial [Candidatus Zixiibacteriota bacterium]
MKTVRRISQILFLLFFFFLFLAATYPLRIKIPVDLFLRMDPLIGLSAMVSARAFVETFLWAIGVLILTIPLGRYFCGWVCPMGTTLDLTSYVFKRRAGKKYPKLKYLKYMILIFLLVGAVFSSQLFWFFDPIALFTRSIELAVWPIITLITTAIYGFAFKLFSYPDWLGKVHNFFSSTLLPDQLNFFRMSGWVLLIFLA